MAFDSGSITFQRFTIVGQSPSTADEKLMERFAEHAFRPTEIGVPGVVEYGWVGPSHILDPEFTFENCVFNDCIHVALRIDTNRVPGQIIQAYRQLEERALAKNNPSGFISKRQKREAKDAVARKLDDELRSGKHRRSKHVPILWDLARHEVYGPASPSLSRRLVELFDRTFRLILSPLSSGTVARLKLDNEGQRRYDNFTPTRFAKSAADPDAPAEYPWVAKSDQVKDYLGNEFLLWLWHASKTRGPVETRKGQVAVMFDRTLRLDCVFNQTGKDALTATGPTRMPEAIDGLRSGKAPRRAGLILSCDAGQFDLTLTGDSLAVSSLKLPHIDDMDTARSVFEERITRLRDFADAMDALYEAFVKVRANGWEVTSGTIRRWIAT